MLQSLDALRKMNRRQLDEVFKNGNASPIPSGDATGTVLLFPGTRWDGMFAAATRLLGWQGKIFDGSHSRVVNKVTPFGLHGVAADVYTGPSWLDGRPAIILDYSKTSMVARVVRDEVREVAPGTYLGFAYLKRRKTVAFLLSFRDVARGSVPDRAEGPA
jgi:hypothetical protein